MALLSLSRLLNREIVRAHQGETAGGLIVFTLPGYLVGLAHLVTTLLFCEISQSRVNMVLGLEKSFSYLSVYDTTGEMSVVTLLAYLAGSAYIVITLA
jgi:hypothetical protein